MRRFIPLLMFVGLIACAGGETSSDSTGPEPPPTSANTVQGLVSHSRMSEVEVHLLVDRRSVRTIAPEADGRFAFERPAAGKVEIVVKAPGLAAIRDVEPGRLDLGTIQLQPIHHLPILLERSGLGLEERLSRGEGSLQLWSEPDEDGVIYGARSWHQVVRISAEGEELLLDLDDEVEAGTAYIVSVSKSFAIIDVNDDDGLSRRIYHLATGAQVSFQAYFYNLPDGSVFFWQSDDDGSLTPIRVGPDGKQLRGERRPPSGPARVLDYDSDRIITLIDDSWSTACSQAPPKLLELRVSDLSARVIDDDPALCTTFKRTARLQGDRLFVPLSQPTSEGLNVTRLMSYDLRTLDSSPLFEVGCFQDDCIQDFAVRGDRALVLGSRTAGWGLSWIDGQTGAVLDRIDRIDQFIPPSDFQLCEFGVCAIQLLSDGTARLQVTTFDEYQIEERSFALHLDPRGQSDLIELTGHVDGEMFLPWLPEHLRWTEETAAVVERDELQVWEERDPQTGFWRPVLRRRGDERSFPLTSYPFDHRVVGFSPDGRQVYLYGNDIYLGAPQLFVIDVPAELQP